MIHFFIDTNVLLSFYSFTQDDLARLEQLAGQVEVGTFVILTTSHVQNEFKRNRESKIAESLKEFAGKRLDSPFPRLCDPYEETDRLRELEREYSELHKSLTARLNADARERTLTADQLIDRFFAGAKRIDVTPEMLERARLRVELGNPPGKRGSIGDAVNWEALLSYSPEDELFFVSDDHDFYSALDSSRGREFLMAEWSDVVGAPVGFVRRLSELPASVPHDVLPLDDSPDERDDLIDQLAESNSFATTHRLIANLNGFSSFTPRQVGSLVGALDNSQVGWIIGDLDVNEFYRRLLARHSSNLDEEAIATLRERLSPLYSFDDTDDLL